MSMSNFIKAFVALWTTRRQTNSPTIKLAKKNNSPKLKLSPKSFAPWNFRSLEVSHPGTFAPWNSRSLELSFLKTGAKESKTKVQVNICL